MSNKRFGRLLIIEETKDHYFICKCDCGNTAKILKYAVTNGRTQSCGCLQSETARARFLKHGRRGTKEYSIWKDMRKRCNNKNHMFYHRYGGRGIKVCERWNDFSMFLKDMGAIPSPKHTIDRINNDGNYEPENCKWSTMKEQVRNREKTVRYTLNGVEKPFAEWCEIYKQEYHHVKVRLRRGWPLDKALTLPVQKLRRKMPWAQDSAKLDS